MGRWVWKSRDGSLSLSQGDYKLQPPHRNANRAVCKMWPRRGLQRWHVIWGPWNSENWCHPVANKRHAPSIESFWSPNYAKRCPLLHPGLSVFYRIEDLRPCSRWCPALQTQTHQPEEAAARSTAASVLPGLGITPERLPQGQGTDPGCSHMALI